MMMSLYTKVVLCFFFLLHERCHVNQDFFSHIHDNIRDLGGIKNSIDRALVADDIRHASAVSTGKPVRSGTHKLPLYRINWIW